MSVLATAKNSGLANQLFEFTHGLDVDPYLASQEVQVQKEWARALQAIQLLSPAETNEVCAALDLALQSIQDGTFSWKKEDEDIHMNLERFLVEKTGETGKRVHLGRSRNDLIATTLRLFVRDSLQTLKTLNNQLILAICRKSEEYAKDIVPGMTHQQNGQPIRFGHVLAAHAWAFARDTERMAHAQNQAMAVMPLGSAALAGTTLDVDLLALASQLGFCSPPLNSYDSVGDRDFMIEGLHVISLLAVHLSRISEDFVNWSSTPVGLVRLPRAWSTGSSIMPNKRNPDVPELIRARSAGMIAATAEGLTLLKGLPSSYNSDLHELKSVFLRAVHSAAKCLEILEKFVSEIQLDKDRAKSLVERGHLLATEIANQLTLQGMPFREAYQKTAQMVEKAEAEGVSVEKLDLAQLSTITYESAVEARNNAGGTALQNIYLQIDELRKVANHAQSNGI